MIRISYDGRTLACDGHAGYAEYGTDIVCAAVSAVLYTLRANLPARCIKRWCSGQVEIQCTTLDERRILKICLAGLREIEKSYPQYVRCDMAGVVT